MRKTMGFIIALAAAGLLAGCSGSGAAGQTSAAQTSAEQTAAEQVTMEAQTSAAQEEAALSEAENSDGKEESGEVGEGTADETERPSGTDEAQRGKTLVVYYSASGNTEQVAGYIAKAARGDLFELEPVEPYTSADLNWSDDNSRVTVEHENPDQREAALVKDTVEGWESYDIVFIGYPKMEQGFERALCA